MRDESREEHRTLEAQRNRLKVRRPDGRIAGQEHRRPGERVVAGSRGAPLPAGRIASPVQIQGQAHDLQVAQYLAVGFLLDLVDELLHRLRALGELAEKPRALDMSR